MTIPAIWTYLNVVVALIAEFLFIGVTSQACIGEAHSILFPVFCAVCSHPVPDNRISPSLEEFGMMFPHIGSRFNAHLFTAGRRFKRWFDCRTSGYFAIPEGKCGNKKEAKDKNGNHNTIAHSPAFSSLSSVSNGSPRRLVVRDSPSITRALPTNS